MKKKSFLMLLLAFALVFSGCSSVFQGEDETYATTIYNPNSVERKVIAHSMGGLEGEEYLGCYQCFLYQYDRGTRYFEIDLRFSTDGRLFSTHMFENIGGSNMTYSEYENYKITIGSHQYDGITIEKFIELLDSHHDVYIIIDTKEEDKDSVIYSIVEEFTRANKEYLLAQIIPYVYTIQQYDNFETIYSFNEYVFTAYQNYFNIIGQAADSEAEIIEFLQTHDKVSSVVANYDLQLVTGYDEEYFQAVISTEKMLYLFTVDSQVEYTKSVAEYGCTGVVTNIINPSMLRSWNLVS